jgi:predicted dehydrogenase
LRAAIIGCGMAAGGPVKEGRPIRGTHAEACRAAGVQLVAAADPDPDRRAAFARHWGVPAVFADASALLDAVRPELVIVATPPIAHEAACLAALAGGARGILCEKPFTGHAAGARRIAEACRAAAVPLVVNFSRRWDASHQEVVRRLSELGPIVGAWGCYVGTLRGNGSHVVDTLRMMVPGPWTLAWASPLAGVPDDGPVSLVLQREAVSAHLQCIPGPAYFVLELTVFGTDGRVRLTMGGNEICFDRAEPSRDYPGYRYLTGAEPMAAGTMPVSFENALQELVRAVEGGPPPSTPPEAFIDTLSLVDAAIAAARIGQEERHP